MMGRAVGKLVDSIETADIIVSNEIKARRNLFVGFQPSLAGPVTASSSTAVIAIAWAGGSGAGVISILSEGK
jgi:hypothetical protein